MNPNKYNDNRNSFGNRMVLPNRRLKEISADAAL